MYPEVPSPSGWGPVSIPFSIETTAAAGAPELAILTGRKGRVGAFIGSWDHASWRQALLITRE
jgi:hypothetical protein